MGGKKCLNWRGDEARGLASPPRDYSYRFLELEGDSGKILWGHQKTYTLAHNLHGTRRQLCRELTDIYIATKSCNFLLLEKSSTLTF